LGEGGDLSSNPPNPQRGRKPVNKFVKTQLTKTIKLLTQSPQFNSPLWGMGDLTPPLGDGGDLSSNPPNPQRGRKPVNKFVKTQLTKTIKLLTQSPQFYTPFGGRGRPFL